MRSDVVLVGSEHAADRRRGLLRWPDAAALAILVILSLILFRSQLFGDGLYIGNPDRLNSNLKTLKFHLDSLATGHLDAWDQFEMLGYDTFALPYTFPSIFTVVAYLIGPENLYVATGYELPVLLAMAGIAAYAFVRVAVGSSFPAFIGAILYQFSALTIQKVSQNDLSFAVFILIPVLMLVIRQTRPHTVLRSFLLLTVLIFLLLHFTFLQKASYAMILAGTYCLYRTVAERNWRLLAVFPAGSLVAIIGAFPRLYGIALAMREYARSMPGRNFDQFVDVYLFQAVFPMQILRWFDGGIFGRYPSEATIALQSYVNVTEGFLLYTSSFVPFLVLLGIVVYRDRPLALLYSRRGDGAFFVWFFVFTVSVIVSSVVLWLVWLLYFQIDFTHARILIVGLLPLSVIVALVLTDLKPAIKRTSRQDVIFWISGAILAFIMVLGIDWIAQSLQGSFLYTHFERTLRIRHEAIARIGMSFIAVVCLVVAIRGWSLRRQRESRALYAASHPHIARIAYWSLGLAIGLQTFLAADFQINGSHTHTGLPFLNGNIHYSTKANFHPPQPNVVSILAQRLDNENYRSVLLCNPEIAGGFCAGHVPEFWRLRVIDGYYGLGVPRRLAALPWRFGLGLRTISYTSPDLLDWPILGLLNVKYAVVVDEALYRNNSAGPAEPWRPLAPDDVKTITNPSPVAPRYYFTRYVIAVSDATEAVSKLFQGNRIDDVTERSYVENFPNAVAYSGLGTISPVGSGDRIKVMVQPAGADRFLVANELYYPGWTATVDGKPAQIYPTNAVMRGVVVPAGATTIEFTYTPFTRRNISFVFYGTALLLAAVGAFVLSRSSLRPSFGCTGN
jgi:hypothetical protein